MTQYKIQSIERAVRILDVIAEAPRPLTLSEITLAVGLHKPTAHRFVHVLKAHGVLEVSKRGLWRLGPKCEAWNQVRGLRGGAA